MIFPKENTSTPSAAGPGPEAERSAAAAEMQDQPLPGELAPSTLAGQEGPGTAAEAEQVQPSDSTIAFDR